MEKNFQELNLSLALVGYPRKLKQKECYQFKAGMSYMRPRPVVLQNETEKTTRGGVLGLSLIAKAQVRQLLSTAR